MNITMAVLQNVELDHVTYYYNVSWHIICMEYAICFYFRPFNQLNVNVDKSSNLGYHVMQFEVFISTMKFTYSLDMLRWLL